MDFSNLPEWPAASVAARIVAYCLTAEFRIAKRSALKVQEEVRLIGKKERRRERIVRSADTLKTSANNPFNFFQSISEFIVPSLHYNRSLVIKKTEN